ncbi:penicillin-binding protein 1C [Putridiphycobacter roseus]|uniref:peptidoglycan glycosyltransferase n=1 Tax=Putridiphycobacter roseus TaxID=2219161 RepID=A0A2W1NJC1_9FLAO|nr:penicillin-binding protein 1C [Putridiphycobacter roseus]PZE18056.1 penicillin-binding protein 1C [Putridiphycobacter roseus]
MKISKVNKRKLIGFALFSLIFYWCFPKQLFNDPYATILNDADGQLLSAKIAKDGQWRFPELDSVPKALADCILYFEDEYFYAHPGVNPVSMFRAIQQNIASGKTISGGSTITMQVLRMSRHNPKRTYWEKFKEIFLAIRMEFSYSKSEILNMYVSHAPYGGNVVGAEAAAWRYFNRPLSRLSWAEYATLAVLPNAPALIRPGKNSAALKAKRNRLLKKLMEHQVIDSTTYTLSLLEALPTKPNDLPSNAYHLLEYISRKGQAGKRIESTIDGTLQLQVSASLNAYVQHLQENSVNNACAMVIDLETANVKAYVGNANFAGANAAYVDLIQARRSSGSILKPFLYANAIQEGRIHPSTLLKDVPVSINGFSPSNFNKEYEGVVRAEKALARSLNVPATNLLKSYGMVRFYEQLKALGFTTIDRSADNYGLTLILGGAEVSLWEVAKTYANQARKLNAFFTEEKELKTGLRLIDSERLTKTALTYDYGTWWLISKALQEVQRPGIEGGWKKYSSSRKVAWKTGTSFGFRDAWAVGYDAKYLVAVWVGNAQGEGRPGLTGVSTAAPLMFNIFQRLPEQSWFESPESNLKYIHLCATSGLAPSPNCPTVQVTAPLQSKMPSSCTYHQVIHLNSAFQRVFKGCVKDSEITDSTWFVLSPIVSYYYKKSHPNYDNLPPYSKHCLQGDSEGLAIIYPQDQTEVIIPKNFDQTYEKIIVEATHHNANAQLFWHLDNTYVGKTKGNHALALDIKPGLHHLSIIDSQGNKISIQFKGH